MPGAWLFLLDGFAESIPSDPLRPLALSVPRPVNTERFPAYFLLAYEPPKPAVQTLVAIVAHHEIGAIRNCHRPEIVARIDGAVDDPRIDSLGEWFIVEHDPIHQHGFIAKLHGIARCPHHPFDEILFFVFGKPEDDDVSPLRLAEFNECLRSVAINGRERRLKLALTGPLNAVRQFADQDMISNQQCRNHRTGGNLEGLDDKHPDRKGQEHRHDNGFCIFAKKRLLAGLRHRRRFGEYCRCSCGICSPLLGRGPEVVRWGALRLPTHSSPTFKMARKASCGTSTLPTDFMRFFPSFCFSRSLRFRVISPP